MCIDYRPINKITVRDQYPIPRIDEILDRLSAARIFTTLDATSGYYQIERQKKISAKQLSHGKAAYMSLTECLLGSVMLLPLSRGRWIN
jgi:hypothetical protein